MKRSLFYTIILLAAFAVSALAQELHVESIETSTYETGIGARAFKFVITIRDQDGNPPPYQLDTGPDVERIITLVDASTTPGNRRGKFQENKTRYTSRWLGSAGVCEIAVSDIKWKNNPAQVRLDIIDLQLDGWTWDASVGNVAAVAVWP